MIQVSTVERAQPESLTMTLSGEELRVFRKFLGHQNNESYAMMRIRGRERDIMGNIFHEIYLKVPDAW